MLNNSLLLTLCNILQACIGIGILFLQPACAEEIYTFGTTEASIRSMSKQVVEIGVNDILKRAEEKNGFKASIKVVPNQTQLENLLNQHLLQCYYGSPIVLLKKPSRFNLSFIYAPVIHNKVKQRYLLLMRKDSPQLSLEALHKANLAYCNADDIGLLFLQNLLRKQHLGEMQSYFAKTINKTNPNQTIAAVFFKEAQAALVLESDFAVANELNPQLSHQLVAIHTSDEYIVSLMAFSKNLVETSYANIVASILMLNSNPLHQELNTLDYSRPEKIDLQDLNNVRELYETDLAYKGQAQ